MKSVMIGGLSAAILSLAASAHAQQGTGQPVVVLRGLDKITARVSTITGRVGETQQFGRLEIRVRQCWKSDPGQPPEQAALIEITEIKPDQKPETKFTGWMFASSPALSALAHPVYDITLLECRADLPPEEGDAEQASEEAGASESAKPAPVVDEEEIPAD